MPTSKNPFSQFSLEKHILSALTDLGYEKPTPVQEQAIPILLEGKDLLAQAQTGTGKTAAFALPILSQIDLNVKMPQALVLAPTRELAIQVAEAFQSYAKHIKGFLVTPVYGGQDYNIQLRLLKRGPHVIVGTPGRLMDHLRRGTLPFDAIKAVVLDEADEMLRMGFVDDVEWILGQIKHAHQTALFSATLPTSIQKIAQKYLKNPEKIQIVAHKNDVETIEQCYVIVARNQKLDMLTRFLEAEEIQAMIVFARTKNESAELSEKLQARGYKAAALNGDMSQGMREKTIDRLRNASLDILVATDVAARGIDVERVTHVVNYDIPYDVDSYVHRIGRTGRAGREGKAILFVTPRETRMLDDIENHVKKPIKRILPPSLKDLRDKRANQLSEKILKAIDGNKTALQPFIDIVKALTEQHSLSAHDVGAALMYLDQEQNASSDVSDEALQTASHDRQSTGKRYQGSGGGQGRSRERFGERRREGSAARGPRDRGDRFEKKSYGSRDEKKGGDASKSRGARFDRSDRAPKTKTEGGENSYRGMRNEKSPRTEKSYAAPRSDRGERADKGERNFSSERPVKTERTEKTEKRSGGGWSKKPKKSNDTQSRPFKDK